MTQDSNIVLYVVVLISHIEGAAKNADTFCIFKMLNVMMWVKIQLFKNTHKAMEIQYSYTNVLFLEYNASPVISFTSSMFVDWERLDIAFSVSSSERVAISSKFLFSVP
jgi:hypothetical protein